MRQDDKTNKKLNKNEESHPMERLPFRMKIIQTIMSAVMLLTFFSCIDNTVYHHYISTPLSGWGKSDTLSFHLPKTKTEGQYSMDLGLRVSDSYPFTSLTLIIQKTFFPSMTVSSDTIHCKLRDEKGAPRQKGVSFYQYNFHIADLQLQQDDSLHINIRHNMKREMLPGIGDVGILMKQY